MQSVSILSQGQNDSTILKILDKTRLSNHTCGIYYIYHYESVISKISIAH